MPKSDAGVYTIRMWQHALRVHADLACPDGSGALPYVPAEVETLMGTFDESLLVLDVGCLGGYGLFDFVLRCVREGKPAPRLTGVDASDESIDIAQHMVRHGVWCKAPALRFVKVCAEEMPFDTGSFNLVIARLLLPYVDIAATLSELARVTAPGGLILFQLHAPRYYWRQVLKSGWRIRPMAYYFRPMLSFLYCRLIGRQARWRRWRETALTPAMLEKWVGRYGLEAVRVMGDASRPMVLFRNLTAGNGKAEKAT